MIITSRSGIKTPKRQSPETLAKWCEREKQQEAKRAAQQLRLISGTAGGQLGFVLMAPVETHFPGFKRLVAPRKAQLGREWSLEITKRDTFTF